MKIRLPSKKVCERFHLTYELKGAWKAVGVLSSYYGIRNMKIVLNGRKVGNGYEASYNRNVAYFKKGGLNNVNVLHEFFHHIVLVSELKITEKKEEKDANRFAREVLKEVPK